MNTFRPNVLNKENHSDQQKKLFKYNELISNFENIFKTFINRLKFREKILIRFNIYLLLYITLYNILVFQGIEHFYFLIVKNYKLIKKNTKVA